MNVKTLSLGAGLLALAGAAAVPAEATRSHEAAMEACSIARGAEPALPITAIADGRGGSLVWLTDAEINLWLCSADSEGRVLAYTMIFDDLLAGAGASLVEPIYLDETGKPVSPAQDPAAVAALACQAYLGGQIGKVVGSGIDGLNANWIPGYFVFIETVAGEIFLCDATPNAQVWAFAKIGGPIKLDSPVG